jgi:ferredoxin
MCRKCEEACPRGAIKAFNFPPRKPKAEVPAAEAPKPTPKLEVVKETVLSEAPATNKVETTK